MKNNGYYITIVLLMVAFVISETSPLLYSEVILLQAGPPITAPPPPPGGGGGGGGTPPPSGGGIPLPAPGGGSGTQPGSGQGGPAQGNNSPPVPIEWKIKYASTLERVKDEKMPILIFFTTEEFKSLPDKLKLPGTSDLVKDIGYLMITLVTDTKDKDKDDLNIIKKILKAKEPSKNKDETDKKKDDKNQTNNDPPKEEIEMAVKYQVTSVPQLVWCDCYGNELQKGNIQIISTNSSSLLKREAKLVIEKQKELKSNLETQYKDMVKRIEDEKKKGELSAGLIQKLQKIAQYEGYEPSQKARRIIEENNK
jgi:hypothetical protein